MSDRLEIIRHHPGSDQSTTEIEILAAHARSETKLEYIAEHGHRKYGYLYRLCRLITICNIFTDYRTALPSYPENIRVVLDDDFLWYSWYHLKPMTSPRIPWRPPNRYCEPETLSAELVALYHQQTPISNLPASPQPQVEPHSYGYQYDAALDTDLRIGTEEEHRLVYRGRPVRWINGTREYCPIASIAVSNGNDYSYEVELLNELMSVLAFETDTPIRVLTASVGRARPFPYVNQPRKLADSVYPLTGTISFHKPLTPNRTLALALYREGISSQSVYYRMLNFYKILEIPYRNRTLTKRNAEVRRWINTHCTSQTIAGEERIHALQAQNINIGKHIQERWRNAIAHVERKRFINPDETGANKDLYADLFLMEQIARLMVESDLLD
jgi:hypothetical protein